MWCSRETPILSSTTDLILEGRFQHTAVLHSNTKKKMHTKIYIFGGRKIALKSKKKAKN